MGLYKLENLSTYIVNSNPAGVKFTVFVYNKLVVISAYTSGIERLEYGIPYKAKLPNSLNVLDNASSITGNNGSAGHLSLRNNVVQVSSTSQTNVLTNTFMGQLVSFLT